MSTHAQVKVIGSNGQISLGKEYAGKTVVVEKISEGVWMIKSGQFIPDNEKWIYESNHLAKLEKALHWADTTKRADNFDKIAKEIVHGKKKS